MREIIEFRIWEDDARKFLEPDLGVMLGDSIRKVVLPINDKRVKRIAKLNQAYRKRGDVFFTYWDVRRSYSPEELESAPVLDLIINAYFEPTGSMCGTGYNEMVGCQYCRAGFHQVSDLMLDTRRIPKGKDIAKTIAGEVVISPRLVQACREHGIHGADFRPVLHYGRKGPKPSEWSQLVVTSRPLKLDPRTKGGNNPFDLDEKNEFRCPEGHTAGLNLVSEVFLKQRSWDGSDWCQTDKLFGMRSGELRPEPRLLISQKLRQLLVSMKAKGFILEPAHLV
ncbi:MAG TPA: hypothetical protein VK539_21040 [Myxococcaceae bacterium]|nr:hypothetical protein [Myxococcaceae bacterium]